MSAVYTDLQHHAIARLTLDIRTGHLGDVGSIQEEVSRLIWQQAISEMAVLFDQLVGAEEVVRLDRLEVELQPLDAHSLATDFVPSLLNALRQSLSDALAGHHSANGEVTREWRDRPSADWEIWLYFLEYGRLPWWGTSQTWKTLQVRWEAVLQNNTGWHIPFRALISRSPSAQTRLVSQFPVAFRHQIILLLQPTWIEWRSLLSQAHHLMESLHLHRNTIQMLDQSAWKVFLEQIAHAHSNSPFSAKNWLQSWFPQLMQQWLSESVPSLKVANDSNTLEQQSDSFTEYVKSDRPSPSPIHSSTGNPKSLSFKAIEAYWQTPIKTSITADQILWHSALLEAIAKASLAPATSPSPSLPLLCSSALSSSFPEGAIALSPDEKATGIYLNHAGLVLLHPFLKPYFEDAGLLAGSQFQNETCQQIAIYLLHYLATHQTSPPEYELVLPKLLCGWPLNEAVHYSELPDAALTEAEHLLQTVIHYWDALKNTSPDGLREGFLQRSGKLTRTGETAWKLQVEQQSIDVLLSRLPWGVSMVKLPWMDNLLTVEWT
jgi:hypothetical protein